MKVGAVVVSHGHPRELEESLPILRDQVDELVVIANIPASVPEGVEAVHNEQPLGFGTNVNRGAALTTAELVLSANPDAVPEQGAVDALRMFMTDHVRAKRKAGTAEFYRDILDRIVKPALGTTKTDKLTLTNPNSFAIQLNGFSVSGTGFSASITGCSQAATFG